jgi:hypothetical protein
VKIFLSGNVSSEQRNLAVGLYGGENVSRDLLGCGAV